MYAYDIMHDLFEGVVPYDMKLILTYLTYAFEKYSLFMQGKGMGILYPEFAKVIELMTISYLIYIHTTQVHSITKFGFCL